MKPLYLFVITLAFACGWQYGWAQTKAQAWYVAISMAYAAGAVIRFNWLGP